MPRRPAIQSVPTPALQAELRRREAGAAGLRRRRHALARDLAAVERELSALDGAPRQGLPRGRPGRPPKARPTPGAGRAGRGILPGLLTRILTGRTMSVGEAAQAARAAGYPAKSAYFTKQVANVLADRKRFRRVRRGRYRAR